MKQSFSEVFPIAHRGFSGKAPENTLAAVKMAMKAGIKYIEIDVQMTKDKFVVALHDDTINRTSNGRGNVADLSLVELKQYDFGAWFDPKFADEKIPTLGEVLEIMDNKTVLIIELKNGSDLYPGIESIILKEIDTYHRKNQVILKSFNKDILNKFKLLAPNVPRLYCTFFSGEFITIDDGIRFEGALKGALDDLGFSYLQIHRYFITKGIIAKAQSKGIKIIVWDVHDKENIQKFSGMGVDFIESDFPDLIL